MLTNDYTGIVESAIRRLILSRTSRFRLRPPEVDDLQQRIVLALLDFQFSEARANGATVTTAITGLIDRQIKAYLRAEGRYKAHLAELTLLAEMVSLPEPSDMRMDIEEAMHGLSAFDRQVCTALADGLTVSSIARQLGCGRDTVDRAIARIRHRFEVAGLRAWVDPDADGEQADVEAGGQL